MNKNALQAGIFGVIGGFVLTMIVGFAVFDWDTAGTVEEKVAAGAEIAVVEALTPLCVANAMSDLDSAAKLAALKEERSYRQDDFVLDAGWATMPGMETGDRKLAQACATALEDMEPAEIAKS